MEINYLLDRLNRIDEILRNRTKTSSKMIGTFEMKWTEQAYSPETIKNITDEKSSIITRLDKEGFISSEEMGKYYLSDDFAFTPKISYENVKLNLT